MGIYGMTALFLLCGTITKCYARPSGTRLEEQWTRQNEGSHNMLDIIKKVIQSSTPDAVQTVHRLRRDSEQGKKSEMPTMSEYAMFKSLRGVSSSGEDNNIPTLVDICKANLPQANETELHCQDTQAAYQQLCIYLCNIGMCPPECDQYEGGPWR